MKKMILNHIGRDSWDRPIYDCNGKLYVDVNPRYEIPAIHTKSDNDFDGEPDWPIASDIEIEFVPERDVWE